jgi:hypothetical protein
MHKKTKFTGKHVVNFFLSFIIFASFFLIYTTEIHAQLAPLQSLRVTPVINDLKLIPGKTTTFKIYIENISNNPVGIHVEINGNDVLGDTPISSQKTSAMVNWTNLSTTDLILGGKQIKSFIVSIKPPDNTGQSGYYETFFLTPMLHQQETASSPIILSRIGILVLGTIGNLNYNDLAKKVVIQNFTPSVKILNSFPQQISFTVSNNYFSHFDAKPFLTITPLFGNPQTTLLIDKHVLPGSERIWYYQPDIPKTNIFYQMHLAVSIGGGKQIFANTWFIVLPYKPVLFLLIIAILLYIAITKHKRMKKFLKILLHG